MRLAREELLPRRPEGGAPPPRRMAVFLENSADLGELARVEEGSSGGGGLDGSGLGGSAGSLRGGAGGAPAIVALCGDARAALAVLASGRLVALSWQGEARGAGAPLADGGGARGRRAARARSRALSLGAQGSSEAELAALAAADPAAAAAAFPSSDSLEPATPRAPGARAVAAAAYCPAARLLALVLADGAAAVVAFPRGGLAAAEDARLAAWAYRPPAPGAPTAVAAAPAPDGGLLALGLSHGRVALLDLQALLAPRRAPSGAPPPLLTGAPPGYGAGLLRVLSLGDWGHASADVGAAGALAWAPDGAAFAVGHARRGLALWTPSGCRLACTLRVARAGAGGGAVPTAGGSWSRPGTPGAELAAAAEPLSPAASAAPGAADAAAAAPLEGGVAALAWAPHGHSLLAAEARPGAPAAPLAELALARAPAGAHRVARAAPGGACLVMFAADRLLLIEDAAGGASAAASGVGGAGAAAGLLAVSAADDDGRGGGDDAGGGGPELALRHAPLPPAYLDAAWPLRLAAASPDGADVAAAGARGLAVFSRAARRWRLFGDALQERALRVRALAWLPGGALAAAALEGADDAAAAPALVLYPRRRLDAGALLARRPLPALPVAMDAVGPFIALAFAPLELLILRVDFAVLPDGGAALLPGRGATLTAVRELSILDAGAPLRQLALAAPPAGARGAAPGAPLRAALLRAGGAFSALDLAGGGEAPLAAGVEAFWLPGEADAEAEGDGADAEDAGDVEMPWWAYGASGMQLWLPSALPGGASGACADSGAAPASAPASAAAADVDPELEFDREVWPLGVSAAEVSVLGVTQRAQRGGGGASGEPPSLALHPHPEAQPVLPCLLRRLLQRGRAADAAALARRHAAGPHFARSLEWLLFTSLEADAGAARPAAPAPAPPAPLSVALLGLARPPPPQPPAAGPLLVAAARLVAQFPQAAEIVVSVARKTDAALWPALFAAAGAPSALADGLAAAGALRAAACALVIVEHAEGGAAAQALALRLVRAALAAREPALAADLLRFLLPEDGAGGAGGGAGSPKGGAAAAARRKEQPAEEQQQPGWGGWLWSLVAPEPAAEPAAAPAAAAATPAEPAGGDTPPLPPAAAAGLRAAGGRAWELLERGGYAELAALAAAVAELPGGLAGMMAAAAPRAPAAPAQRAPSAAAAAAALRAAAAGIGADAAAELRPALAAAGAVNAALALALLCGDAAATRGFATLHAGEWRELRALVADDPRVAAFAPAAPPPGTPPLRH
jgi:hypothetical protein